MPEAKAIGLCPGVGAASARVFAFTTWLGMVWLNSAGVRAVSLQVICAMSAAAHQRPLTASEVYRAHQPPSMRTGAILTRLRLVDWIDA
jgi:hypothetical protein